MKTLTTILSVLSFAICIVLGLTYVDLHKKVKVLQDSELTFSNDSSYIEELIYSEMDNILDDYLFPVFTSIEDVHNFSEYTITRNSMMEEFNNIPADVLINVACVLINQNDSCTIPEIIDAYKKYQNIYDNLPAPQQDSITTETIQVQPLNKLDNAKHNNII